MSGVELNRREFVLAVAASAASAHACSRQPDEPARATLVRLLGLGEKQARWVDSLSPAQQEELRTLLLEPDPQARRQTIELLMKVIGRRDRLFAYVGYPALPQLGACDGLIRE
jgi:hypothetical protein